MTEEKGKRECLPNLQSSTQCPSEATPWDSGRVQFDAVASQEIYPIIFVLSPPSTPSFFVGLFLAWIFILFPPPLNGTQMNIVSERKHCSFPAFRSENSID